MSGMSGAIIGGAIIGAGASIYAGSQSAGAIKSASKNATNAELTMYNQSRADLTPARELGYQALDQIAALYGMTPTSQPQTADPKVNLSGFNPFTGSGINITPGAPAEPATSAATRDLSGFYASPNYNFVRGEGLRGLENSAAARGGALSGNAIRGSEMFASNLASGEFNSYVDRLFNIAGLGTNATNAGVAAGQNSANNLSAIYQNEGNARASAYTGMASGVNSAVQGGLQNWAFMNYLNSQPKVPG